MTGEVGSEAQRGGHSTGGAFRIVVMGVSAAGKTTVGGMLAGELGLAFHDADGLHPQANVDRMSAGIPLTDEDRAPWLARVGAVLAGESDGAVVACSALKRRYREQIRQQAPKAVFVHLSGDAQLLRMRGEGREGHFMPPRLLDSQLADLEPLRDEPGFEVSVDAPEHRIVEDVLRRLGGCAEVGSPSTVPERSGR